MTKADEKILAYLTPTTDNQLLSYGNDTYFCGCSKHLKSEWKHSCLEKVKEWVEKNGGRYEEKSDWVRQNDKDGKIVQIIFPSFNRRNMKEIMQTLFVRKAVLNG